MIRFCSSGTSATPISTPRSPRATITASVSSRISSSASTASAFSIFAITCACEPACSISARRSRTSAAERTNESATKSTPSSSASSRSSMSLRVIEGIGTGTPGRFTPLCEVTTPPSTTAQRARPDRTLSTRSRTSPSSISTSWPGWSTSLITAGLIGSSPFVEPSAGPTTTDSPRRNVTGSSRSPMRSLGPCRSAIRAIGRPSSPSISRTSRAHSRCWSCVPCERFSRAPSTPARTRSSSCSRRRAGRPDRGDDLRAARRRFGHRASVASATNGASAGSEEMRPSRDRRRGRRALPRSAAAGCTSPRGRCARARRS